MGEGLWSRQEDIVHSEVGLVVQEALKVAVAQESSVSAVAVVVMAEDSMEVVVVSKGHDIAFDMSLLLLAVSETREWWLQCEGIDFLFNVLKLTQSLVPDLYDLQGALTVRTLKMTFEVIIEPEDTCPLPAS